MMHQWSLLLWISCLKRLIQAAWPLLPLNLAVFFILAKLTFICCRVRLSKRRKLGSQRMPKSWLEVKHRELNSKEQQAQVGLTLISCSRILGGGGGGGHGRGLICAAVPLTDALVCSAHSYEHLYIFLLVLVSVVRKIAGRNGSYFECVCLTYPL